MANQKFSGVKGEFYVGSNKTLGVSNYDLSVEMGVVDVSDHDSGGWGEDMTTTAKWSATITAWYLGDNTTGVAETSQAAIMDACPVGTLLVCKFRPFGANANKTEWSGNARIKSYKLGAPNAGAQPFNFDIVGSGTLSRNNNQS